MDNPVRALRERLGLSRRELAIMADLAYVRVAEAELGYHRRIPLAVLEAIARATGVDADALARDYVTLAGPAKAEGRQLTKRPLPRT